MCMAEYRAYDVARLITQYHVTWPPRSFLARLDTMSLHDFLAVGKLVTFDRNETIIVEGADDTSAFLLLSACVKVTARLPSGGEALLAVRFGGEVIGELAALDGGRRSATVRGCAREPVVAVELSQPELHDLQVRHPEAARTLNRSIVHKLRSSTRRRIDYTGCPPHVRLARALVEMADDHGWQRNEAQFIRLAVDLTQVEIGTLVGVKPATAQRALRRLRDQALISTDSRPLVILDIEGLRKIADQQSVADQQE